MTWLSLTTPQGGAFSPAGLVAGPGLDALPLEAEAPGLLAQGTLYMDIAPVSETADVTLFEVAVVRPWAVALSIHLHPGGRVSLRLDTPGGKTHASVQVPGLTEGAGAQLTYFWDGPNRMARLSLYCPDTGDFDSVPLPNPKPLPMSVVQASAIGKDIPAFVYVVGFSDSQIPTGPMPGLPGQMIVETTLGTARLDRLRMGDCVYGFDGLPVPVLAAVTEVMPCYGAFAPTLLRPRKAQDGRGQIVAHHSQMLCEGPEVEYLTGAERVLIPAGDLPSGRICALSSPPALLPFSQVICTEPAYLHFGETRFATLHFGQDTAELGLRNSTVARSIPGALVGHDQPPMRVLRAFEAVTLGSMMAA